MHWLNKAISYVAPNTALKREVARRRIDRLNQFSSKRSFDAVSANRLRYDFLHTNKSPDSAIKGGISALREHVRQMEFNNGFVSGPIRRIVKNVVGQGIYFQSKVQADKRRKEIPKINQTMADEWNFYAEKYFRLWAKQADKRLMTNYYGLQKLVEGSLVRDNEVLVIGRNSNRKGRLIPYCQEVLEADRLQTPAEEINNPRIRHGIRYDDEGVPVAYFILKAHPGDTIAVMANASDFEEVPAFNKNGTRKVMHLFNPIRPEQSRGFTQFASGLKDFQDLDRYMEAEKMAALEAACLTGIVKSQDPVGFQQAFTESSNSPEEYDRIHEFAPGMWHYLKPGEEASILNPSRPNESFGDYIDQLARGPANALDIPPEVLTQNWKDFNYSNARTVLLQFWATCAERQKYLIDFYCAVTWENVARDLVWRGLIPADGFARRPEDFLRSSWIPSVYRKWVDPLKESKGKESDVDNNFDTLTDVCAEQGKDVDEVLETRARELRKIKDLEEQHAITITKSKPGAMPKPDEPDEEEEKRQLRRVK